MTARPFRYLAPVLAAVLGLFALRTAGPPIWASAAPAPAAGEGGVVFRHYL